MSIRTELREQLHRNKEEARRRAAEENEKKEREITLEARDLIENFITPKFMQIAARKPYSENLTVVICCKDPQLSREASYYYSDIDQLEEHNLLPCNNKGKEYSKEAIMRASDIAGSYDIWSKHGQLYDTVYAEFSLDLNS